MLLGNEPLDLRLTLVDSAQCFRWVEVNGRFGCVLMNAPVWLWRDGEGVHAESRLASDFLRHYLDMNRDYGVIAREYAHIPPARTAIQRYPGLRVLNQPAWEALICFILSANNNVSRIQSLVAALCRHFGAEHDGLYAFPTPEQLAGADEEVLRDLKVGYRAPFLIGTARRVLEGFPLEALCGMPYPEAHKLLTTLPGVGDKVADCVLLFGCEHASAFPVDVWVERLMGEWFGVTCRSRSAVCRQARALLGEHAGIMQQFLFHAARTEGVGHHSASSASDAGC